MSGSIPLVDLSRQHRPLKQELEAAFARVMEKGDFILGEAVTRFEREFAAYCGVRHGVGVASGTDALHLALVAEGVGPGDTVITTSTTFIATALAASYAGAEVAFAEVEEDTFNMSARTLEEAVASARRRGARVKAVVPVHLYGRPCPMEEIMEAAARHGLAVVEDACQAHGAVLPDAAGPARRAGSAARSGCFSFYPGKNLGGAGDGGMVVTDDEALAARLRLLRNYGQERKYVHLLRGFNSRLDTLQAEVLSLKLPHLDGWNRERAALADAYREALASFPALSGKVIAPSAPTRGTHIYHIFAVRTPRRDELLAHLHARGIFAGIHYPIPIHRQEAYAHLGMGPGSMPVSERLAAEELSLPLFPGMTGDEVGRVVEAMAGFRG